MAQFISVSARAIVLDHLIALEGPASQTRNYYIDTRIRLSGERLPKPGPVHVLDRKTVLVFADDRPLYNWEHHCRYILVNANTLQVYAILPGRLPPYFFLPNKPDSYVVLKKSVHFPQPVAYAPFQLTATHTRSPGDRFAILYSSRSDVCHYNDMAFLHQTLVQKYGYSAANIKVLNYDGHAKYIPGEGTLTYYAENEMEIYGPGTRTDLAKAITDFPLKTTDSLLIYTSNHGSWSPTEGSAVLGHDDFADKVFAKDLAQMIKDIPVKLRELIVIGQQCFSGGFLAPIAAEDKAISTCVISSCLADKESRSDIQHNPFSLHFISALAMRTPDGVPLGSGAASNPDSNGDGLVSMREAFAYAYERVNDDYGDVPQIHPASGAAGDIVLGEKTLLFTDELPLLEPLIREKWKTYDKAFDNVLRENLNKLKKIEKRMQSEQDKAKSKALDSVEALLDD